jgi:hypothetical protein
MQSLRAHNFPIQDVDRQHKEKRKNFQQLIWLVKYGNKEKRNLRCGEDAEGKNGFVELFYQAH